MAKTDAPVNESTSILRDLFRAISAQAVAAAEPKPQAVTQVEVEPDHVYFLGDDKTPRTAAPAPRDHQAHDLSAVLEFAAANETASIFYDRGRVTCLIDDATRRDRVELTLKFSPQLITLMDWEQKKSVKFSQRPLILLLRTHFRRCLEACAFLVDSLRKVTFQAGAGGTGDVGKHKASLTREMMATVSGEAELVDEFVLVVPVFDGFLPAVKASVTVAMDADGADQSFTLIPVTGDVEAAVRAAEDAIGKLIIDGLDKKSAVQARVYYGRA